MILIWKKAFFLYFHFWTVLSIFAKSDRKFDESSITFCSRISKCKTKRKTNRSNFRYSSELFKNLIIFVYRDTTQNEFFYQIKIRFKNCADKFSKYFWEKKNLIILTIRLKINIKRDDDVITTFNDRFKIFKNVYRKFFKNKKNEA